jgi:hypothetical protein
MTSQPRRIAKIIEPKLVTEDAGVTLMRSIATRTLDYLDPPTGSLRVEQSSRLPGRVPVTPPSRH